MLYALSLSSWSVYVVAPLGLCLSFLLLATLGGAARRLFLGARAFGELKPWAFDVVLGMLLASVYFVLRSFLKKVFPWMPAVIEQEPALLAIAFMALARRSLLSSLWKEATGERSVIAGLVFFSSIFVWGYWHFFSLLPDSSDPGVISGLIEATRRQGMIPHVLAAGNPALPSYPIGIEVLSWSVLNPLVTTLSVVQTWPSFTTSLMAFTLVECFSSELRLKRGAFRSFLAAAFLFRVLLGAFEASHIWSCLEGVSKRSLGFAVAFAAVAAWKEFRRAEPSPPLIRGPRAGLILVALAFPVLVNPINFYVSAAGTLAYGVFLAWTRGWSSLGRAASFGLPLALAVVALASLQDPMWMRRLGPQGISCRLFAGSTPYCSWDDWQRARAEKVSERPAVDASAPQPGWESHLPSVAREPGFLFYPAGLWPLATAGTGPAGSLLLCLPLAALCAAALRRRIGAASLSAQGRPLVREAVALGLAASWGLGCVPLLARLQTFLIYRWGDLYLRRLLQPYSDQAYVNLWQPLYYAVVLFSLALCCQWAERVSTRSKVAWGGGLLGCAALLCGLVNAKEITNLRAHAHPDYGRSTSELASLYLGLREKLRPEDTVMLTSYRYIVYGEPWVFPEGESFGLQLYTPNQALYSYSGQWRPSEVSPAEHFERTCRFDCDHLRQEGVDVLVDIENRTSLCGMSVSDYARASGCFLAQAQVQSRGRSLAATLYRLSPHEERRSPKL